MEAETYALQQALGNVSLCCLHWRTPGASMRLARTNASRSSAVLVHANALLNGVCNGVCSCS